MYLRGYNVMHVRPQAERFLPSQRDAVREVVSRNLMGAEIIEDQLITVAILMGIAGLSVKVALKRMFLIAMYTGDKELAGVGC
jgi:hypothetical protein